MARLSFSQISKYNQCPRSYKLYYQDKLRDKSATAFLAFGSAMDESLNAILNDVKLHGSVSVDYKAAFDRKWQKIEINKQVHDLMDCTLVGYAKADFVPELLTEQDIFFLKEKAKELIPSLYFEGITDLQKILQDKRSGKSFDGFIENEHKMLNIVNWVSMRRKGHLMLEAYIRDIVPLIEQVKEYQFKVELDSNTGDTLVGYIDAVVKFKGDEDYYILDNKTASSPYEEDKVRYSQQLAIYAFALGLKKASFAVMLKNIRLNKIKICSVCKYDGSGARHKTCPNEATGDRCGGEWMETVAPEAVTQLLRDTIDEQTQQVVAENIGEVNDAIKAKVFPKNLSACANIYGNPCPYMRHCWKNDSSDLVKLEDNS